MKIRFFKFYDHTKNHFLLQTKDKMSNSNWSSLFTEKQEDPEVRDESKSVETLSIMETHSRYCFILHPIK